MKYRIVDIDGTICDTPPCKTLQEFFNLDHADLPPIKKVINFIDILEMGDEYSEEVFHTIFLTARCETLVFETIEWLDRHMCLLPFHVSVCMRPFKNKEESHIYKLNVLKQRKIKPKDVQIWLEDDEMTLKLGRELGFKMVHPNEIMED